MAEVKTYKCDVCGAQKNEANHWFKVFLADGLPGRIGISLWEPPPMAPEYKNYSRAGGKEFHLCGLNCLYGFIGNHLK